MSEQLDKNQLENQKLMSSYKEDPSKEPNKRVIVPTHRGKSEIFMLIGTTGDFIVCDSNHKLVYKKRENGINKYVSEPVVSLKHKSALSPLRDKKGISLKLFFKIKSGFAASEMILLVKKYRKISLTDKPLIKRMSTYLAKLAFTRREFDIDNYLIASSFRTLASVLGYNLIAVEKKNCIKYRVKFTRPSATMIHRVVLTGLIKEVGSCTVINKESFYANQGFYQRNTGGDMIRRNLIMFYQLDADDKEYHENAIACSTVHDEINWFCKKDYLHTLYNHIQNIMNYDDHGRFPIPIEVSVGVSPTDWGSCLDVDGVSEDNKLIIHDCEGVEPYDASQNP